jgi:pSer/pThr/pTyr-binding forkhead associated (FHA) protein
MGPNVTFQVLEGVDKGKVFRELSIPLTIGREEGNLLRLNDERVSRFHAKIQQDGGDIILTDLESTNGTRVNGSSVQIRRLRAGDRVGVGRSVLLFGSNEEIAARMADLSVGARQSNTKTAAPGDNSSARTLQMDVDQDPDFNLDPNGELTVNEMGDVFLGVQALPPLPQKLGPAQVARLAEILDFLHRGLVCATENIQANEEGTQVTLNFNDWQKVQIVQMLLARYLRAIADPEAGAT